MNADQLLTDLGPGSTVGNKGGKRGQIRSNRINIGERNEPSGGLGREKGRPPPFPVSTLPLGSLRSPVFYFAHADFFLLPPPMRSLVPGLLLACAETLPSPLQRQKNRLTSLLDWFSSMTTQMTARSLYKVSYGLF